VSYLPEKLEDIETKVRRLIEENKRLAVANTNLKEENNRLKFRLAEAEENGIQAKTAGVAAGGEKDNVAIIQLKEKIDSYTEEIDKCIEWLSEN